MSAKSAVSNDGLAIMTTSRGVGYCAIATLTDSLTRRRILLRVVANFDILLETTIPIRGLPREFCNERILKRGVAKERPFLNTVSKSPFFLRRKSRASTELHS